MPFIEFFICFIFIALFFYSLINYKSRIAAFFSLIFLSIAVFTFGYGIELLSKSEQQMELALNVEFIGVVFIPAFSLLISYEFYFHKLSSFLTKFLILFIPFTTLFICLTNSLHFLYYSKFVVVTYANYSSAYLTKGPWYYVFISYTFLAFLFSLIVFYKKWRESLYHIKTQAFWMLIGTFCTGVFYIIYIIFPIYYDITTFGFALLALCYFIAIYKYDFLNLFQIAKERVFDEINEGIIVIDEKNRVIDFNCFGNKTFQWLNSSMIGKNIMLTLEGNLISNNTSEQFIVEVIRNKQKIYLGFRATPIIQKNKASGKILIFQDITEQTIILDKLNKMAAIDPLSGVFNRRKLMEEAEKEFYRAYRYGTNLSALMIDIDFFKNVNDTYGHMAGDKVITCIAKECKERLRKSDIIGRYGGEEFLVLLTDTNLENALLAAEDIRDLIEKLNIEFENKQIKVKVSIGVASTSTHNDKITIYDLINESDKALYNAKNTGRNRVCNYLL